MSNATNAGEEVLISLLTVWGLPFRWKFFAGKDTSATLAIANSVVYFYAFTSDLIWQQKLSELTGFRAT